ncbi:MAG: hypothetical protein IKS17_02445 [Firmicutes bacterium]|nr:hypothetical protein [Bacillota bacterium]
MAANIDINTIKDAVIKLSQDEGSKEAFAQDPVKAVESLLGVDLPDELINNIISAVKEKTAGKDINDIIKMFDENKGLIDKVKDLFTKK